MTDPAARHTFRTTNGNYGAIHLGGDVQWDSAKAADVLAFDWGRAVLGRHRTWPEAIVVETVMGPFDAPAPEAL